MTGDVFSAVLTNPGHMPLTTEGVLFPRRANDALHESKPMPELSERSRNPNGYADALGWQLILATSLSINAAEEEARCNE